MFTYGRDHSKHVISIINRHYLLDGERDAVIVEDAQALLVMAEATYRQQFGPAELERLRSLVVLGEPVWSAAFDDGTLARLAEVEVLITSWGCPPITAEILDRAPRLRASWRRRASGIPPSARRRQDARGAGCLRCKASEDHHRRRAF